MAIVTFYEYVTVLQIDFYHMCWAICMHWNLGKILILRTVRDKYEVAFAASLRC